MDNLLEGLELSDLRYKGDTVSVKINGNKYVYTLKDECPYDAFTMYTKIKKMMQYSHGRALQFLKKNMVGTKSESDNGVTQVSDIPPRIDNLPGNKKRKRLSNKVTEVSDEDKMVAYRFPRFTDDDRSVARKDYNLKILRTTGDETVAVGRMKDIKGFADDYLGYQINPEYLDELQESFMRSNKILKNKMITEADEKFRIDLTPQINNAIEDVKKNINKFKTDEDIEDALYGRIWDILQGYQFVDKTKGEVINKIVMNAMNKIGTNEGYGLHTKIDNPSKPSSAPSRVSDSNDKTSLIYFINDEYCKKGFEDDFYGIINGIFRKPMKDSEPIEIMNRMRLSQLKVLANKLTDKTGHRPDNYPSVLDESTRDIDFYYKDHPGRLYDATYLYSYKGYPIVLDDETGYYKHLHGRYSKSCNTPEEVERFIDENEITKTYESTSLDCSDTDKLSSKLSSLGNGAVISNDDGESYRKATSTDGKRSGWGWHKNGKRVNVHLMKDNEVADAIKGSNGWKIVKEDSTSSKFKSVTSHASKQMRFDQAVKSIYNSLKSGSYNTEEMIRSAKMIYNLSYTDAQDAFRKAHEKYEIEKGFDLEESSKRSLKESKDGRFHLEVWVPGSGGDDDRERTILVSNSIDEILDAAYDVDLDSDEAFLLQDWEGIYRDLDQVYSYEDLEDQINNDWHYDSFTDMRMMLGKKLMPPKKNESSITYNNIIHHETGETVSTVKYGGFLFTIWSTDLDPSEVTIIPKRNRYDQATYICANLKHGICKFTYGSKLIYSQDGPVVKTINYGDEDISEELIEEIMDELILLNKSKKPQYSLESFNPSLVKKHLSKELWSSDKDEIDEVYNDYYDEFKDVSSDEKDMARRMAKAYNADCGLDESLNGPKYDAWEESFAGTKGKYDTVRFRKSDFGPQLRYYSFNIYTDDNKFRAGTGMGVGPAFNTIEELIKSLDELIDRSKGKGNSVPNRYFKESLDISKIKNRLDHFAGQITINREDEKEMKDLLNKKNISFMIDDSKPGKLVFKLRYPDMLSNESLDIDPEDEAELTDRYEYIKSKSVPDSDGFLTDYTMYYDKLADKYVFVFGDSDLYRPEDEEFDWEEENEEAANEWFDSYEGFTDEDDEVDLDLNESKKLNEYFDIYNRDVVYWIKDTLDMDKSMTKEEFIDEFMAMYPASRRDAEGAYDSWKDGVLDQYVKDWEDELNESKIRGGSRINYDDDLVVVYHNGKEVYKGIEDYEPMNDEPWKWDDSNKYYTLKNGEYIKVCLNESLKESADVPAPSGPERDDTWIANEIINNINGEWDTITKYNGLISFMKDYEKFSEFIPVINDINNEEHKHIGQLQEILKKISPNTKSIASGEEEGAEQIDNAIEDNEDDVLDIEVDEVTESVNEDKDDKNMPKPGKIMSHI